MNNQQTESVYLGGYRQQMRPKLHEANTMLLQV